MKATYELKKFRDSNEKDISKALFLYTQNIEPKLRTDTREILYWLDNYRLSFEDKLFLLGFYKNDLLIGFSQAVYFIEEKVLFVDYIVIDENHRRNNTFYEFVNQIQEYVIAKCPEFDYILGEVGYFKEDNEPAENTRNMIRLLKMNGFKVIKAAYYQPMLGNQNLESEVQSILMLYSNSDVNRIKGETFKAFLKLIYYKHYKRWYDHFFNKDDRKQYAHRLNELFKMVTKRIDSGHFIELNGYSTILPHREATSFPTTRKRIIQMFAVVLLFALFLVVFGVIHIWGKEKLGLDSAGQTTTLIAALFSVFLVVVIYENKSHSISSVLEKVFNKLIK